MSSKQKAVEDLKKFSKAFKGWLDLADELERLISLENQTQEIELRLKECKLKEQKAIESLSDVESKLQGFEAHANKIKAEAVIEAQKTKDEAQKKAEKALADAHQKAESLLSEALIAELAIKESVGLLKDEKASLMKEVVEEKAALAEIHAQIKALKEMLK